MAADPDADFARAVAADVELGISSSGNSSARHPPCRPPGARAPEDRHGPESQRRGRGGLAAAVSRASELEREGRLVVVGVFSHFANTSRDVDAAQRAAFERALAAAAEAGLRPATRHLASSEQAIRDPQARYDVVRIGIGMYGLTPSATARPAPTWGSRRP